MIGHVSTGRSFAGLARYLALGSGPEPDPGRVAWVETRNLLARSVRAAAAEMADEALLAERVRRPVYHLIVSFDPDDDVDRPLMVAVADRVLGDFGLGEHQAVLVAHGDTPYAHVHLMVNRVSWRTGTACRTAFDYRRMERALRELERELGLRETPGKHYRLEGPARGTRSPEPPPLGAPGGRLTRAERAHARRALRTSRSWAELEGALVRHGMGLAERRGALHVTRPGASARAGALVRGGSLAGLQRRFGVRYEAHRSEARAQGSPLRETAASPHPLPGHRAGDPSNDPPTMNENDERTPGAEAEAGPGRRAAGADGIETRGTGAAESGTPQGEASPVDAVVRELRLHSHIAGLRAERAELVRKAGLVEARLAEVGGEAEALRALDARVDRHFERAFRDPAPARAAYDAEAVLGGPAEAARALRTGPERFGDLQGAAAGPVRSPRRLAAWEEAGAAAEAGERFHARLERLARGGPLEGEPSRVDGRGGHQHARDGEAHRAWAPGERRPGFEVGEGGGRPGLAPDGRPEALYQDPDGARRAFERLAGRLGPDRAARAAAERPEALGPIRPSARAWGGEHVRGLAAEAFGPGSSPTGGVGEELAGYGRRIGALEGELARVQDRIAGINGRLASLPDRKTLEGTITLRIAGLRPSERADLVTRLGQAGAGMAKTSVGLALRAAELAARAVTREAMGRDVFER